MKISTLPEKRVFFFLLTVYFFSLCSTSGRWEMLTSQSLWFRKNHFAQVCVQRERERERQKKSSGCRRVSPFLLRFFTPEYIPALLPRDVSANWAQTQTVLLLCQAHLAGFTAVQRKRETLFAARFTFSVSSQRWVQQISRRIAKDWSETLFLNNSATFRPNPTARRYDYRRESWGILTVLDSPLTINDSLTSSGPLRLGVIGFFRVKNW